MRLDDDMRRVVREQSLGFVATVCPDGTPNLSPKGTTVAWGDEHIAFLHICSPGTVANLLANPGVEINVVDPIVRKGYRFKGTGEVLTEGPVHDDVLEWFRRERGTDTGRVEAVVLVHVDVAAAVISPAYDTGATEAEVVARWRDHHLGLTEVPVLLPVGEADRYLLENSSPQARSRFDGLAELFNPWTFRHIETLGITDGWRCWEVGVGGPSIPTWLAGRVGASGSVLATDIDVRWAEAEAWDNVEVRRHDVAEDDPPRGPFDLVHERLVLIHVPQRERALATLVGALGPGGWLLVEDFDSMMVPYACPDARTPAEHLANSVRDGFRALLVERGADLQLGRKLPRMLGEAGLVDVGADAYVALVRSGTAALETANVRQARDGLVAGGYVTDGEVEEHLRAVEAGEIEVSYGPLVSAWGRVP